MTHAKSCLPNTCVRFQRVACLIHAFRPLEFKFYWATTAAAAASRSGRSCVPAGLVRLDCASHLHRTRQNPSLANVPIALSDLPGRRVHCQRFALEWPFGARSQLLDDQPSGDYETCQHPVAKN
eukprot:4752020-Prymnesium_polylepis.1